jgi:mono/diheme cytochrome c family protein
MRITTPLMSFALVGLLAPAAFAQDAAKVERGKAVYVEQKCATCHIIEGKGGKMAGPLDGVGTKLSAEEIRQWVVAPKEMEAKLATKPKMSMKAYPNLPKDDLDALVAYMQSLKSLKK